MDSKEKGKLGEKLAVQYLKKFGYNVLDLNYHSRFGEIDVIATYDGFIVFVEVKLRKEDSLVSPSESVIKSKQRKIIKTAVQYISKNQTQLQPRFDVVEIKMTKDKVQSVNHIENAFWQEESYSAY